MKRLVVLLTIILSYCCPQSTNAQDALNRWTVSLGTNAINNPVRELEVPADEGRFANWNQDAAAFKLTAGYYLGKKFTFLASGSINNITEIRPDTGEEFPYVAIDGAFKFDLISAKAFNPYLKAGGGYTWFDNLGAGTFNGGAGFNIWLSNNFGFFIESIYKLTLEDQGLEHWQHSAGIVFKFGVKDKDKDGIRDQDDQCPEEFGLLAFDGCPDTDGDGVKDSEDQCPNIPGLIELGGCPDSDGDNVPDKFDKCPNQPGSAQLNGCPDTDGDGTPDNLDRCPQQAGESSNAGCPIPDTDGDGIKDNADRCPKQPGPASNNGCPVQQVQKKQKFGRTVYFEYGKTNLSNENKKALDEIAIFIINNTSKIFHIGGHADNTYTEELNLKLSRDRAEMVKQYLVSKGVDEARLTIKGYGETRPLNSNESGSDKVRARNRRVEIFEIK